MIDTVKLLIPIKDLELLQKVEGNLTRFRKEDLSKDQVIFEFHSANIKLCSHYRNVSIKSTRNPLGLFVELSFAKYDKGNNVEMIYPHDLLGIAERLHTELCFELHDILPPITTWPIYRLDVCYNWLFKSEEEAGYAMDFIQRIDYPRKKKYLYDSSVMYTGSAYVIKAYLKGEEFLKHDYKELIETDGDRTYELQQYAKRIVRFEVGLRRKYLSEFMGLKDVFITDIADDEKIEETLKHFLDKTFFYINPKSTTEAEVSKILHENFSKTKAMRLYQFYMGYFFDKTIKAMYLSGGLDRSTIYRYKKDLKLAGIGHGLETLDGKGILEQLIIPSPNTRFDLLDQ
jgi:hypothetical protein